ncbi:MAG: methyltransferase domain-containing protein [Kineosporiaceae bacterium]
MDKTKLMDFVHEAVGDVGAVLAGSLVVIGDRLGFYRAMAGAGPVTSEQLAAATGTAERHVREWLAAQAACGYLTYLGGGRYEWPDEHAVPRTQETSPAFVAGAFEIALGSVQATDRITEAMRTGQGLGWGEQDPHVHVGCERLFRPSYVNFLTTSCIPAMDGVAERLATGIAVADIGCGHGASTIQLAQAYPRSRVTGIDPHEPSIDAARKHAADAGVADRVAFQRATAKELTGTYGLIAFFDCLPDLGDPVDALRTAREHLDDDGTLLIVEPERRRHGRGEPRSRRRRLLRHLHPAVHAQLIGAGGGRRHGHAGRPGPPDGGRPAGRLQPGATGRRDTVQHRPRDHALTRTPLYDRTVSTPVTPARAEATEALLTAAEDLLVEVGYVGITVRKLAERAGVNHGLVHYYFGSMQDLLLYVLERFTDGLVERQRAMYAADTPFVEKWRQAMRFLDEDARSGYHKIWFELQAMGWNDEIVRERLQNVHKRWIDAVRPAFEVGLAELGVDPELYPPEAVVSLVVTFNQGIMLERLSGVDSGHRRLLGMIDSLIDRLEKEARDARASA